MLKTGLNGHGSAVEDGRAHPGTPCTRTTFIDITRTRLRNAHWRCTMHSTVIREETINNYYY